MLLSITGAHWDEMSDILKTASVSGIQNEDLNGIMNFGDCRTNVTRTYDSTSGWWTLTLERHRGNVNGFYYSDYSRVYKHQFLNKDGLFQKNYITGTDTAYSIKHEIVSGTGIMKTPKLSHQLTSLSGASTITGTNTDFVTFNSTSPYVRSVADTMTRNNSVRTLNGTLTLNFINVTGPRGGGVRWHLKTGGTIEGTYHAVVTFQRGGTYTEKTIDRIIHIVLGVDPANRKKAEVNVSGSKFYIDIETGEFL